MHLAVSFDRCKMIIMQIARINRTLSYKLINDIYLIKTRFQFIQRQFAIHASLHGQLISMILITHIDQFHRLADDVIAFFYIIGCLQQTQ